MKLICPVCKYQTEYTEQTEECGRCGTPLRSYVRLSAYPDHLFNLGLTVAREGQVAQAREYFAAVVHWCPTDLEARNALAMACFQLGDTTEARRHWEAILEKSPNDSLSKQGIEILDNEAKTSPISKQQPRTKKKRKHGKKKRLK